MENIKALSAILILLLTGVVIHKFGMFILEEKIKHYKGISIALLFNGGFIFLASLLAILKEFLSFNISSLSVIVYSVVVTTISIKYILQTDKQEFKATYLEEDFYD